MPTLRFKRVYMPVHEWEETAAGMWSEGGEHLLQQAVEFTGDHARYGHYMRRVIMEWPVSCVNALTDHSINQRAWVGHAAAAMAFGCPEHITRKAWSYLSNEQQFLANREAEGAIREWRLRYSENRQVRSDMGVEVLPGWDS